MTLILTSPPLEEPVSLAELKLFLRISHAEEDALLATMLTGARRAIEAQTSLAMVSQGWRLIRDRAPAHPFVLPRSPLASVEQVTLMKRDGTQETVDPSTYEVETGPSGRIFLGGAVPWSGRALGALRIDFTAGWESASETPQELKMAVMIVVAHFYENREGGAAERIFSTLPTVERLIAQYRDLHL